MNLPVKKVENHTYNLKYGTADSTSRRNSGDAYVCPKGRLMASSLLIDNQIVLKSKSADSKHVKTVEDENPPTTKHDCRQRL